MTDEELFAGLEQSVKAATGFKAPATPTNGAKAPSPAPEEQTKGPKSLSKQGIGRGGIIRNPTTKRRQQLNNPVTNPKPPSTSGGSVPASTPDQELKASNPALAFPSVMTGMDMDMRRAETAKPQEVEAPPAPPQKAWAPPPEADDIPMTTTLVELLVRAAKLDGKYHVGKPEFVVTVQILSQDLFNYLRLKSQGLLPGSPKTS